MTYFLVLCRKDELEYVVCYLEKVLKVSNSQQVAVIQANFNCWLWWSCALEPLNVFD